MIRKSTTKIAIIVAVLSVGTIATISLLDTKAYAGFDHPDPETTQIHGPTLNVFGCCEDFLSVLVVPYPNQPTKLWLDYSFSNDVSATGQGCMLDKRDFKNNHLHFDTSELDCDNQSGEDIEVEVELSNPNGFEMNSFSGDREFCFTLREGIEGPLVRWCDQVTGHAESQSWDGSATVIFDGGEVVFDLDAEIDDFGVFNHATAGKCNVKLEGDPVMFSSQIQRACSIFGGIS